MRLTEFVSANPMMAAGSWRQELVAGEPVQLPLRSEEWVGRCLSVFGALSGAVRRAKSGQRIELGSGVSWTDEAGADHFRIADVIVATPPKVGRRYDNTLIALVVEDATALDAAEEGRFAIYKRQKGIREVLLFSAGKPLAVHWRQIGGEWSENRLEGQGAVMRLASVKASVSLLSVYTDLEPEIDP
ncbi:hypothetical protein [Radicibacter daui]|uniref:hypothetical protein n=1 Tax=Radicibacter daui TaxID=3064829 RepID=UPI004046D75E